MAHFPSGARIWCVFDFDEHPNLSQAITEAAQSGIDVAVSNPCFELWLVLHLQDQTAYTTRRAVQRRSARLNLTSGKQLPDGALDILADAFEIAKTESQSPGSAPPRQRLPAPVKPQHQRLAACRPAAGRWWPGVAVTRRAVLPADRFRTGCPRSSDRAGPRGPGRQSAHSSRPVGGHVPTSASGPRSRQMIRLDSGCGQTPGDVHKRRRRSESASKGRQRSSARNSFGPAPNLFAPATSRTRNS